MGDPTRSGEYTDFNQDWVEWFKAFSEAQRTGQPIPPQPTTPPTQQSPFFNTLTPGLPPPAADVDDPIEQEKKRRERFAKYAPPATAGKQADAIEEK